MTPPLAGSRITSRATGVRSAARIAFALEALFGLAALFLRLGARRRRRRRRKDYHEAVVVDARRGLRRDLRKDVCGILLDRGHASRDEPGRIGAVHAGSDEEAGVLDVGRGGH